MPIAIGDIHGCLTELEALLAQLPSGEDLIFLGDYVDRGPQSAGVIAFLERLALERPCVFLMGNHEQMMYNAIRDPDQVSFWLVNGGESTLDSYGKLSHSWRKEPAAGRALDGFDRFYLKLRFSHEDEHAWYVHAGIDPDIPKLADQKGEVLLWIRERFYLRGKEWQGKPVIFGHTPTRSMGLPPGEIFRNGRFYGIDTGCVYGGHLTAMDTRTFQLWQVPGPSRYRYR